MGSGVPPQVWRSDGLLAIIIRHDERRGESGIGGGLTPLAHRPHETGSASTFFLAESRPVMRPVVLFALGS